MRSISLLVLLRLGATHQRSCGGSSSKWCSASLLQTPKQGAGAREDAVQDQLRGDFSETLDQLRFHELELQQMMGVEHPEALAPAAKPNARLATAAAASRKSSRHADKDQLRGDFSETLDQLKFHELELEQVMGVEHPEAPAPAAESNASPATETPASRKSSRPPAGMLMFGEHVSTPGSGYSMSAALERLQQRLPAFKWTCGPTIFASKACGYFSGYVGFPFLAVVGVLTVLIVLELVLSSFVDDDQPGGGTKLANKAARRGRMATRPGGNLSTAWQLRTCALFIVVVPVELYVFYETGMLQAAWQSLAPYLVLLVVLGTCFFPACVSIGTCLKDVLEAVHDRLDELFAVMDEVAHGAERAWEGFEEEVGLDHNDSAAADAKAAVAGESSESNKLTNKKEKKGCC